MEVIEAAGLMLASGALGFVFGLLIPYKAKVEVIAKTVLLEEANDHSHVWGTITSDGRGWRCTDCGALRSGEKLREVSRS